VACARLLSSFLSLRDCEGMGTLSMYSKRNTRRLDSLFSLLFPESSSFVAIEVLDWLDNNRLFLGVNHVAILRWREWFMHEPAIGASTGHHRPVPLVGIVVRDHGLGNLFFKTSFSLGVSLDKTFFSSFSILSRVCSSHCSGSLPSMGFLPTTSNKRLIV